MSASPKKNPTVIDRDTFYKVWEGVKNQTLTDDDYAIVDDIFTAMEWIVQELEKKKTTITRLRRIIWAKTERRETNAETSKQSSAQESDSSAATTQKDKSKGKSSSSKKKPSRGHGRMGAKAYWGAQKHDIAHKTLKAGDPCPLCSGGPLTRYSNPAVVISLAGNAPISGSVYNLEQFRCSSCDALITAEPPPGAEKKYSESAVSTVAVLKYGHGFPFYRLAKLQQQVGIPLPASNQYMLIEQLAALAKPIVLQLWHIAAQSFIFYEDDTTNKILKLPPAKQDDPEVIKKRKGIYTTGIVAFDDADHPIVLYQTGQHYAGENLAKLLDDRSTDVEPPLVMCDALKLNIPKEHSIVLCNCLVHGRRQFLDIESSYPSLARHVIEQISVVYDNDARTKELHLSPEERLIFHQHESKPIMDELKIWLQKQLDDKKVEPNSVAGNAIKYMFNHWDSLTQFLKTAGAPLDNNISEQVLKMVILNRKNSYFYNTPAGAAVADILMSLIVTCTMSHINPITYFNEIQKNVSSVTHYPQKWLPFNFMENLHEVNEHDGDRSQRIILPFKDRSLERRKKRTSSKTELSA